MEGITVGQVISVCFPLDSICIENQEGEVLELNCSSYITDIHRNMEVLKIYPEKYKAIGTLGITLVVKEE